MLLYILLIGCLTIVLFRGIILRINFFSFLLALFLFTTYEIHTAYQNSEQEGGVLSVQDPFSTTKGILPILRNSFIRSDPTDSNKFYLVDEKRIYALNRTNPNQFHLVYQSPATITYLDPELLQEGKLCLKVGSHDGAVKILKQVTPESGLFKSALKVVRTGAHAFATQVASSAVADKVVKDPAAMVQDPFQLKVTEIFSGNSRVEGIHKISKGFAIGRESGEANNTGYNPSLTFVYRLINRITNQTYYDTHQASSKEFPCSHGHGKGVVQLDENTLATTCQGTHNIHILSPGSGKSFQNKVISDNPEEKECTGLLRHPKAEQLFALFGYNIALFNIIKEGGEFSLDQVRIIKGAGEFIHPSLSLLPAKDSFYLSNGLEVWNFNSKNEEALVKESDGKIRLDFDLKHSRLLSINNENRMLTCLHLAEKPEDFLPPSNVDTTALAEGIEEK